MRRLLIIFLFITTGLSAQDAAFKKLQMQLDQLTPYAALYRLQRYQVQQPLYAPVYLELGSREEKLVNGLHPIADYAELSKRLYNISLYLGNYKYYSSKITLDIEQRIDSARQWRQRVDTVYDSYFALEERYSLCRRLFTQFMQRYPGEKNAHLLLQDEDLMMLQQLALMADSLADDFSRYQSAVRAYGCSLAEPVVRYLPIRLYRLDGLTASDLMADTVALWDYATWTRHFLTEQESVYTAYLCRVEQSLQTEVVSDTLLNYIDRIDPGSFVAQYLHIVRAEHHLRSFPVDVDLSSPLLFQQLAAQYHDRLLAHESIDSCAAHLNPTEWSKYHRLFEANGDSTPAALLEHARQRLSRIDNAYTERCSRLYALMAPNLRLHAVYTNDLSGETVTVDDLHLTESVLAGMGTVVELIPVDRDFLVVAEAGVVHTANPYQLLTYPIVPVYAAVKLSSNRIALIGSRETVFVDRMGKMIK